MFALRAGRGRRPSRRRAVSSPFRGGLRSRRGRWGRGGGSGCRPWGRGSLSLWEMHISMDDWVDGWMEGEEGEEGLRKS